MRWGGVFIYYRGMSFFSISNFMVSYTSNSLPHPPVTPTFHFSPNNSPQLPYTVERQYFMWNSRENVDCGFDKVSALIRRFRCFFAVNDRFSHWQRSIYIMILVIFFKIIKFEIKFEFQKCPNFVTKFFLISPEFWLNFTKNSNVKFSQILPWISTYILKFT